MKFQIEVIKSKIHRVTVTQANLNYVGSITIDEELLDAANMIEGEKVQIMDINNGERFETYIIKGERGSGAICLNGAAARKVQVGDVVIIASYALMDFEDSQSVPALDRLPRHGDQPAHPVVFPGSGPFAAEKPFRKTWTSPSRYWPSSSRSQVSSAASFRRCPASC